MPKQLDKILIVDDDPEVRSLLREQVLDARRYEVIEAQDGPEGLSKVSSHNPDLIILDLIMPGLRGADFLVALKSHGYAGPVIVSTKRGSEAQAIDCFRLGATDYLRVGHKSQDIKDWFNRTQRTVVSEIEQNNQVPGI